LAPDLDLSDFGLSDLDFEEGRGKKEEDEGGGGGKRRMIE
jgi:hypothetical protein